MPQGFFSISYNRILGTLVLAAALIALGAYAMLTLKQADQWNSGPVVINVTGTGEVFAKPDIAQFTFTASGEEKDAAAAQAKSATVVNAVTNYLKEQGIDEKDVKTENYYMTPKYTYTQKPCAFGSYCPPGEQIADGFTVSQTISVKVRKVDTAGSLLTEVGKLGATDVSGLNFTLDDEDKLKVEARALAIADAKVQADKLVETLGMKIVKMTGYYEEANGGGYPYAPMNDMAMSAKAEMAPTPTPTVPTGENKIMSKITLMYEVK